MHNSFSYKAMQFKVTFLLFVSLLCLLTLAEENEAEENEAEVDLKETSDEAIGDRIMDEMNGMKEKFDVALNRIDEEITKDQKEQEELKVTR